MSVAEVYTVGNLTIDDIVIWPSGRTWMDQPGGNALFSALGARIWLDRVGILTRLGRDYPRPHLAAMARRGLVLGLHPVDTPTLHNWALYEADGGRQFINHLNSGTNEEATPRAEEIADEHRHGRAYHIAPVPLPQQAALVQALKRRQRLISIDPHFAGIGRHKTTLEAMLAAVNFFLPSEYEARLLYGANDPETAARAFAACGPEVVVIKMGGAGALVYETASRRLTHIPAYPAAVQDTTGAGDAFCGGFLAGYLLTGDAVTAAQYGTISASYIIEAVGALAACQPSMAEAHERVACVVPRTAPARHK